MTYRRCHVVMISDYIRKAWLVICHRLVWFLRVHLLRFQWFLTEGVLLQLIYAGVVSYIADVGVSCV